MTEVRFYDTVDDSLLKFAVIIACSKGRWVFCKHKERDTYEIPGGHREPGENILDTAKREFDGVETFGGLYFADIEEFEEELHSEIERISFFDSLPEKLTYPMIQPKLVEEAKRRGFM